MEKLSVINNCYQDNFIRIFKNIIDEFLMIHHGEYEYIIGEINNIKNVIDEEKEYLEISSLKLNIYYKSHSIINSRSKALNILSEIEKVIKDKSSLFMLNGYIDNNICGGILLKEKFYCFFKTEIIESDGFYFLSVCIDKAIVFAINDNFNETRLIDPTLFKNPIGGVLISDNMEKRKKLEEMIKKLNAIYSQKEQYKDCYDDLENKVPFIITLTSSSVKKNLIKIKNVILNQINEIPLEEVREYIDKEVILIKNKIYKQSIEMFYEYCNQNNIIYLCDKECEKEKELKQENILFTPFMMRLNKKNCAYCNKKAEKEYIILKRENVFY